MYFSIRNRMQATFERCILCAAMLPRGKQKTNTKSETEDGHHLEERQEAAPKGAEVTVEPDPQ